MREGGGEGEGERGREVREGGGEGEGEGEGEEGMREQHKVGDRIWYNVFKCFVFCIFNLPHAVAMWAV